MPGCSSPVLSSPSCSRSESGRSVPTTPYARRSPPPGWRSGTSRRPRRRSRRLLRTPRRGNRWCRCGGARATRWRTHGKRWRSPGQDATARRDAGCSSSSCTKSWSCCSAISPRSSRRCAPAPKGTSRCLLAQAKRSWRSAARSRPSPRPWSTRAPMPSSRRGWRHRAIPPCSSRASRAKSGRRWSRSRRCAAVERAPAHQELSLFRKGRPRCAMRSQRRRPSCVTPCASPSWPPLPSSWRPRSGSSAATG